MNSFQARVLVTLIAICTAATAVQPQEQAEHSLVPLRPFTRDSSIQVVSGNPDKPGAPFVIRIRDEEGAIVPVHWHPTDEHFVVVKGRFYVGAGDHFDRAAMHPMGVGDYALMPSKMLHFGWSEGGESIKQIHGIGPFGIFPPASDQWTQLSDTGVTRVFAYKLGERVRASRGEGTIIGGTHYRNDNITQYRIEQGDGSLFWAQQADLQSANSPKRP